MNGRIIAIGDIHGCYQEFAELLDRLVLTPADQVVLLGDLVNRGPDSSRVIDLARKCRALSLLGNHEGRLLLWKRTGDRSRLKDVDLPTIEQLRPEDWAYLQTMRLTYYIPELNTVCVHGGFLPDEPWQKQPASVVTRIQVIDAAGRPRKRSEAPEAPHWAERWNGPPFVIYGHTPRPDVYKLKWSIGLDTGCATGGQLTACILPEKRLVQVKARRRYYPA
ncbi:MAG: metallophosphoesterase [Opitutaceae bacterium]|jgi:predicted phosphodiesterase|nr:metallophosphoesterase [Opitutaceae bacterium]